MALIVNDCPFCGGDDITIQVVTVGEFAVSCESCKCVGPIEFDVMSAIELWNKATTTSEIKQ